MSEIIQRRPLLSAERFAIAQRALVDRMKNSPSHPDYLPGSPRTRTIENEEGGFWPEVAFNPEDLQTIVRGVACLQSWAGAHARLYCTNASFSPQQTDIFTCIGMQTDPSQKTLTCFAATSFVDGSTLTVQITTDDGWIYVDAKKNPPTDQQGNAKTDTGTTFENKGVSLLMIINPNMNSASVFNSTPNMNAPSDEKSNSSLTLEELVALMQEVSLLTDLSQIA